MLLVSATKHLGLLLVAVVLLGDLTGLASALECSHCVCKEDCKNHPTNTRKCPAGSRYCLTLEGPGPQLQRLCSKTDKAPDPKKKQKVTNKCDKDKCNVPKMAKATATRVPVSSWIVSLVPITASISSRLFK